MNKKIRILMSKIGYDTLKKHYYRKENHFCLDFCPEPKNNQNQIRIGSAACFDCKNCISHGEKGDNWIKCIKIEESKNEKN